MIFFSPASSPAPSAVHSPFTFFSLLFGDCLCRCLCYKNTYTKSFVVTLALLPAMVQIVIMLVNGNLGAGVAVM